MNAHDEERLQSLKQRVHSSKQETRRLFKEVVSERVWHSPEELKPDEIFGEIAIVVSEGKSLHVELLNVNEEDIWIGTTSDGYLEIIRMYNRWIDDYDDETFDEKMADGSYQSTETGRRFHGYLWLK